MSGLGLDVGQICDIEIALLCMLEVVNASQARSWSGPEIFWGWEGASHHLAIHRTSELPPVESERSRFELLSDSEPPPPGAAARSQSTQGTTLSV